MNARGVLVIGILVLSGCSEGFKASVPTASRSLGSGVVGGEVFPPSDKVDPLCMSSPSYDTCLFLKNPAYQAGRTFAGLAKSQLQPFQTFGVKLVGLNGSGNLANADFSISTSKSTRLTVTPSTSLKIPYSTTQGSEVEQLMTYYYFRRAFDFWSAKGPLALRNRNLNVIVDSDVSGFEKSAGIIHLRKSTKDWPMALDASQSLYLLATANIHYASEGRVNAIPENDENHQFCGSDLKGCCKSNVGCARALVSGLSLYFVATMFPSKPVLGELSANRLQGVRLCNVIDRDLRAAAPLTKGTAFGLCSSRKGDVHIMGALYASIFWETKRRLPAEADAIDRLYLEHLSGLNGTDTFLTAKAKLLASGSGTLTSTIRTALVSEFARRGY